MAVVHIPRVRGNFGGVVIPRAMFDGANHGLGVFGGEGHPDPAALERDVRRLAKSHGVGYAGKLELPAGALFALEMPDDPAKLFMQLGLPQSEVRTEMNAVNLRDPNEIDIVNRWRNFQQLNRRASAGATDEEKSALEMRTEELGTNGQGALVLQTPFGRAFTSNGTHHAEWQIAADGLAKGRGGRASLFLRAYDESDWAFMARGMIAQLHRFPEQPIGTRDLERMMEIATTESGPKLSMDELRELIEGEVALVRGQRAVEGRDFAQAVSVGFPPHDPKDRSGRRVVLAQFSTPPAVGEVAAEFLKPNGRTILEPTVGNGVLAAASYASGGLIYGLELDARRHGRSVEALPDARISLGDAMDAAQYPVSGVDESGLYDGVLANPPYGKPGDELDKVALTAFGLEFPAKKLETHIAASAINRLREGGNAVLVMPAQMMKPSELTEEASRFQTMLNASFGKVESVALDASLYRNMGSNFPVIVHFCEDRRPDGQAMDIAAARAAVPSELEVMATFDAFYERASKIIQASAIVELPLDEAEARRALFLGQPQQELDEGEEEELEAVDDGPGYDEPEDELSRPEAEGDPEGGNGPGPERSTGPSSPSSDAGDRGQGPRSAPGEVPERPAAPETDASEPGEMGEREAIIADDPDELVAPKRAQARDWFVDDFSPDQFTVPYSPRSRKGTTLAVIERTMANETYTALRRVEEAVGKTVDEFVAEKMGVPYEEFMSDSVLFYPEQVDSLALSFHRRNEGKATIIGDQMGVGKGIQLAAHAYSSMAVEDRPVLFLTNRANLFSDMCIRDWKNASGQRFMDMVKSGDVRPFIFNSDGALRENEKIVFATTPDTVREAKSKQNIGDPNLVMMTYSQVQNASGAWRHQALKNWMSEQVEKGHTPVILADEVHKAAGEESRTGMVVQDLLSHAERLDIEIVYSSATSLKSGKNLPVYTPALPNTGLSATELLLAIEKMPLAMQEILASEMARDGALIERKMSDAGVSRDLVVLADIDPDKMQRARDMTDKVSGLLRELSDMGPVIAEAAKEQFRGQLGGSMMSGSADKVRVETTSVASQLDSFSRYLMGSVKGMFVPELMQNAVANGSKPSVVCEYTADSVSEFVIGDSLSLIGSDEGVSVAGHPNIGDVLKRFADKALNFKGTDGLGNQTEMRVMGFDNWLYQFYDAVDQADVYDLRVNVFDRAREAAEALGMTFEDITGRKYEFREGEDGRVRAFSREKPVTADAVSRYNRGETDVLGLNSGSATGVSAQASPAHGNDLRRREMIKLAFQREITDERQVEGRVHRAGQVIPPRYTIPVTGFAPDDRIANLFNRANRSLTSSTSATRENRTNADHAVDILNSVGEMAAIQVLKRNPMISDMLQIDPTKTQDVARKLLGRSVMLPLAEQSAVLSEVDATFRVISDKLTAEGSNPLRLQLYEWGGKVETVEELVPGDPTSNGIAAQPLNLNQVVYQEKVESLPSRTVISNISDTARRREEPFENMHKAWGYDTVIDRGAINYDHHLFSSVTGRSQEGMRHLWPMPVTGEVAERVMNVLQREVRSIEQKVRRDVNSDELRDASEAVAARLLEGRWRDPAFDPYREKVSAKLGDDALKPSGVAVALRAMWNRREQVERLDKVLPLIEPGNLIAIDVRALNAAESGLWGTAYHKAGLDNGLVPAVVTSARYAADTPFAESKMSFSIFVPGNRFTDRVSVSLLHNAMDVSGAGDTQPIREFGAFLGHLDSSQPGYGRPGSFGSSMRAAWTDIMGPEKLGALEDRVQQLKLYNDGLRGLEKVVPGGLHPSEHGAAMFQALTEAMPQQSRPVKRLTLEGNLFAAMSAVSSSVANATSGEKVVYTDSEGTHRNAILMNNSMTEKLVENVKRKLAKRSVVHSALTNADTVADYLRVTNAVQYGVAYFDETGKAEVIEALGRFYPEEFGGDQAETALANFAETMASIRSRLESVEGTFPPTVMAGGDAWRWATDLGQKAAMMKGPESPRGYVPGIGGPAAMHVHKDADANALGFHDVRLETKTQPHALAAAVGSIDKGQALVMSLAQATGVLVLHKDHPALKEGTEASNALMDRMGQKLLGAKLKSSVLAGEFDLGSAEDRKTLSEVLVSTGTGKLEMMIGGALKEIQRGMNEDVADRRKARLRSGADLTMEAEVEEAPAASDRQSQAPTAQPARGGSYGM